ncbi:MAG: nucleotidyltransferase family protein [Stellaceae bacterium]
MNAQPDSDIDIMIEIDPAAAIGVYEYVALKDYIADLFDGPVDVVNRDGLKPYVRPAASVVSSHPVARGPLVGCSIPIGDNAGP